MPAFQNTLRSGTLAEDAALARATGVMEAMVSAYALIAHADGEVAPAERRRMFAILREHPAMSVFSRDELAGEIAEQEANYRLDPEVAQQMAREAIVAVQGDGRAVREIVAACRALIPADGVAHPAEYRALAEIKDLLGIVDETGPFRPARHTAPR